jgi:lipid-A-disaccharide synthase-like uncharacterized protein
MATASSLPGLVWNASLLCSSIKIIYSLDSYFFNVKTADIKFHIKSILPALFKIDLKKNHPNGWFLNII